MTYKYYISGSPTYFESTETSFQNDFYDYLNYNFENAADVFTISEETSFASGSFMDVRARVNRGINRYTGEKLGDDFKLLLFKESDHPISIGKYYYFDDNYWITYNTETIKNLASSCLVRRCNNVLRWMLPDGTILEEYCSIDYKTNNPRNDIPKDDLPVPGGYMKIYTQLNSKTNNIKENQRFLFGNEDNWVGFRVFGGGIRNFINLDTSNNSSARMLTLEVETYQVNSDTDNLTLGIADYYKYETSASSVGDVVITPSSGNILEGDSQIFNVEYYSSGSPSGEAFTFTVSGSMVPTGYYSFTTLTANSFEVENAGMFISYPLQILCQSTSASRLFDINLRGAW